MTHIISTTDRTDDVVRPGLDRRRHAAARPDAERCRPSWATGPTASDPAATRGWTWVEATFNVDAGNNDEFVACMLPESTGTFDYAYRYTTTGGRDWVYADLDGIATATPAAGRRLTVVSSGDTTAPAVPTGLTSSAPRPAGVELSWDAVVGDPTLYGYEIGRADTPGGPYAVDRRTSPRHRRSPTPQWPRARPTTTSSVRSTRRSTARTGSDEVSGDGRAAHGHAHLQRHRAGHHRRDRPDRVHRRLPRPPRRRSAAVGSGRRRDDAGRRDDTGRSRFTGDGGHTDRVQVRARLLGLRREGRRRAARPPTGS